MASPTAAQKTKREIERKREVRRAGREYAVMAEASGYGAIPGVGGISPLLGMGIRTADDYNKAWFGQNANPFVRCRQLLDADDFVGLYHKVRWDYFTPGFRFLNRSEAVKTHVKQLASFDFARLAGDVWHEWLLCDNAVAFWMKPQADAEGVTGLPEVTILDCEMVDYSFRLGREVLKVKIAKTTLTPEEKLKLNPRWIKAYENGGMVTLDPAVGECFRVLTRNKRGKGLGNPRLKQVFTQLSTYALLRTADWSGAWEHKNVMRQIKKGHEIRTGDRAGEPTHFMTNKQMKAIAAAVKDKQGPHDLISNFDVNVGYAFLDPKFFDPIKFEGTVHQLMTWSGATLKMLESGNISPNLLDAFTAEGIKERETVAGFIESILNDPDFHGELEPPEPLRVGWDPHTFKTLKLRLEYVRLGSSTGLISPQTARGALDVDDQAESELQEEAHRNPKRYTPPFEPKQGLLSNGKGGRPSSEPGSETQPPPA